MLTLECVDEETGREFRDDLKAALAGRPTGINAKIEFKNKEEIEVVKVIKTTPMDQAWKN